MKLTEKIITRIEPFEKRELEIIADKKGIKISELMREIIQNYLERKNELDVVNEKIENEIRKLKIDTSIQLSDMYVEIKRIREKFE